MRFGKDNIYDQQKVTDDLFVYTTGTSSGVAVALTLQPTTAK